MHTLLLFLHVLGSSVIVGVVVLSFVAVLRPQLTAQHVDRLRFIGQFGKWASAWQLLTGILLYLSERDEFNGKPLFWVKVGLYVIEGALAGLILERKSKEAERQIASGQPVQSFTTLTFVHALLIIAIVGAGVWLVSGGE